MEQLVYSAKDVAEMYGRGEGFGYKIIREINKELRAQGYIVTNGKVSIEAFHEFTGLKRKEDKK